MPAATALTVPTPSILLTLATRLSAELHVKVPFVADAFKMLTVALTVTASESDLKLMKELILLLYEVKEWDWKQFDLFDLYFIPEKEWVIEFKHKDTVYQIHFYKKGIEFEDHIYNTIDEFFQYATLENQFLVQNSLDLYGFKKVK